MKRLEVRCCCDPNKVLGHVTHPQLQQPGDRLRIEWLELAGEPLTPFGFHQDQAVRHRLELTVDRIAEYPCGDFGPPVMFDAVKNNDYPIEVLRRVPGFVEKTDGEEER